MNTDPFEVEAIIPVTKGNRCTDCRKRFSCWTANGIVLKPIRYSVECKPNNQIINVIGGVTQVIGGISDDRFYAEFYLNDADDCLSIGELNDIINKQDFVKFKGRTTTVIEYNIESELGGNIVLSVSGALL